MNHSGFLNMTFMVVTTECRCHIACMNSHNKL